MPTIDYLPIANDGAANVVTQAAYVALLAGALQHGYQTGVAPSAQVNKTVRQASVMTAAVANALSDLLGGINVLDDGNVTSLKNLVKLMAASGVQFIADTGAANAYVGVSVPAITAYWDNLLVMVNPANTNTGASTINLGGGAANILRSDGSAVLGGDIVAGTFMLLRYKSSLPAFVVVGNVSSQIKAIVATTANGGKRQATVSGPVDNNGFPNFGGATGGTVVTAAGTIGISAAAGPNADRVGSIVNPSWTGLNTIANGTQYLFLDIDAGGNITAGKTSLAPIYEWGGVPSITGGQDTFNIQQMTMYTGNGAAAPQGYRVYVGQATIVASVVTAITWYALYRRYRSATTATLPATATVTTLAHNLGITPEWVRIHAVNTTPELGFTAGQVIDPMVEPVIGTFAPPQFPRDSVSLKFASGIAGVNGWGASQMQAGGSGIGSGQQLTSADWSYWVEAGHDW